MEARLDELERLYKSGKISQAEFTQARTTVLGIGSGAGAGSGTAAPAGAAPAQQQPPQQPPQQYAPQQYQQQQYQQPQHQQYYPQQQPPQQYGAQPGWQQQQQYQQYYQQQYYQQQQQQYQQPQPQYQQPPAQQQPQPQAPPPLVGTNGELIMVDAPAQQAAAQQPATQQQQYQQPQQPAPGNNPNATPFAPPTAAVQQPWQQAAGQPVVPSWQKGANKGNKSPAVSAKPTPTAPVAEPAQPEAPTESGEHFAFAVNDVSTFDFDDAHAHLKGNLTNLALSPGNTLGSVIRVASETGLRAMFHELLVDFHKIGSAANAKPVLNVFVEKFAPITNTSYIYTYLRPHLLAMSNLNCCRFFLTEFIDALDVESDETLKDFATLMQGQWRTARVGEISRHSLVTPLLKKFPATETSVITASICGDYMDLALHAVASDLLREVIGSISAPVPISHPVVQALMVDDTRPLTLAKDRFGCFVLMDLVKKIADFDENAPSCVVLEAFTPHFAELCNGTDSSNIAKELIAKLNSPSIAHDVLRKAFSGHWVELATKPISTHVVQSAMKKLAPIEVGAPVMTDILPDAVQLLSHHHGVFAMEHFIQGLTNVTAHHPVVVEIFSRIEHLLKPAKTANRALEALIQKLPDDNDDVKALMNSTVFTPRWDTIVSNAHASVLELCLDKVSPIEMDDAVVLNVLPNIVPLSADSSTKFIVLKLLSMLAPLSPDAPIVGELLRSAIHLTNNPNGNRVLQKLLESVEDTPERVFAEKVYTAIGRHWVDMASDKHGSYVVLACVEKFVSNDIRGNHPILVALRPAMTKIATSLCGWMLASKIIQILSNNANDQGRTLNNYLRETYLSGTWTYFAHDLHGSKVCLDAFKELERHQLVLSSNMYSELHAGFHSLSRSQSGQIIARHMLKLNTPQTQQAAVRQYVPTAHPGMPPQVSYAPPTYPPGVLPAGVAPAGQAQQHVAAGAPVFAKGAAPVSTAPPPADPLSDLPATTVPTTIAAATADKSDSNKSHSQTATPKGPPMPAGMADMPPATTLPPSDGEQLNNGTITDPIFVPTLQESLADLPDAARDILMEASSNNGDGAMGSSINSLPHSNSLQLQTNGTPTKMMTKEEADLSEMLSALQKTQQQ